MGPVPVLTVTDAARRVVGDLLANEPDADSLALRVDVVGVAASGREYSYELLFEPVTAAAEGDDVATLDGLTVLVPAGAVDRLRGATLDNVEPTGLVIRNPNRPEPAVRHNVEAAEGSLEQRIVELLDGEINPSLAAHGGFASLDRVEGDVAYVVMGGGCQGCGLAAMTLSEGIKATILERIPDVSQVVDVTDHASGENPFYAPTH